MFSPNTTIGGTAKVDAPNWEQYKVAITLYRDGQEVARTAHEDEKPELPFEFNLQEPGRYLLTARTWPLVDFEQRRLVSPHAEGQFHFLVNGDIVASPFKKQAWEALRIGGVIGTVDAGTDRNRRITEIYADTYKNNQDLRYLGIAAFASKLVGDAMANASMGVMWSDIAHAVGLGPDMNRRDMADTAFKHLARGNGAIYMDMYPVTLAYISDPQNHPNGNIQAVQAMFPGDPLNALLRAWERLHAARQGPNPNQVEIWGAALDMVKYEQNVVLDNVISKTPEQQQFWTNFSQTQGHRIRAPYAGVQPFKTRFPNGSYGNAVQRMDWIEHDVFPKAKQWLLDHPDGINVQTLLSGGYEP